MTAEYPKFDTIPVSTKTFVIMTNLTLDIRRIFEFLPITPYTLIPKRRGRKKKSIMPDPNRNIIDGSILTLELANQHRGVILKKKKNKGKSTDYFRNSVTVVMVVERKIINFKLSRNGKFQMTGCKTDKQAETAVSYVWNLIKDNRELYTKAENDPFNALFIPAMRNIDFNLNFVLDREKLDEYFNKETNYYSLLETSIGYTGVNIKIPISFPLDKLNIKKLTYTENGWSEPSMIPYTSYLDTLKPKEKQKKIDKERFNTFLVFHSGKVIMSSMCEDFARDTYYLFTDIIKKNRHRFQEQLTENI